MQISPFFISGYPTFPPYVEEMMRLRVPSGILFNIGVPADHVHTAEDTAAAAHYSPAVHLHILAVVQAAADNVVDYEVAGYMLEVADSHSDCAGDCHNSPVRHSSLVLLDRLVDSYHDLAADTLLGAGLAVVCCRLVVRCRTHHFRTQAEEEADTGCSADVGCNLVVYSFRAVHDVLDVACVAALIDMLEAGFHLVLCPSTCD